MRSTINLYNEDCLPAMRKMADNQYDLAIVDPPYGIGDYNTPALKDKRSGKIYAGSSDKYGEIKWNNNIPPEQYFIELKRVAKNHIIFGFQFFKKYLWDDLTGVIIHDFRDTSFNMSHADVAITNLQKRTTIFRYLWAGFRKEYNNPLDKQRIHPAEKPNDLYKWLLKNYAKEGDNILDTHGGSMGIAIACWDAGLDLDAYEIDKDYFTDGKNRFENHKAQLQLY